MIFTLAIDIHSVKKEVLFWRTVCANKEQLSSILVTAAYLSDLLETFIIFKEKLHVLEGYIHITVASLLLVFFYSTATPGEGILIDLARKNSQCYKLTKNVYWHKNASTKLSGTVI